MEPKELFDKMEAALVDMDGTLLDTMQIWRQCNIDYLDSNGIQMTPEQRLRVVCAASGNLLFEYARETFGFEFDVPLFRDLQRKRMMEAYLGGSRIKPGAREFLAALRRRGVKIVLSTSTWATHATIALTKSGFVPFFDAICCSDAVDASKSKPDYFEKASALIGVPVNRCVLFDDGFHAHKGARAAGLLGGVGVADATNVVFREELAGLTDLMVDSLEELLPFI